MMRTLVLLMTIPLLLAVAPMASGTPPMLDHADATSLATQRFGDRALVRWDRFAKRPRALSRLAVPTVGADEAARATGFIKANLDLLGLDRAATVQVADVTRHHHGSAVVSFTQRVAGLEVDGRTMTVSLDAQGKVRSVRSDLVPLTLAPLAEDIGLAGAAAAIRARFQVAGTGTPRKVVLATGPHLARVAYRVDVAQIPLTAHFIVWVDAENGAILRQAPAGADQRQRRLLEVVR